ncbi:hypothetical protein NHF46_08325 [Arthrobacter alpinus]|nr:hypothetical protein [Arthrobacter alpinus]
MECSSVHRNPCRAGIAAPPARGDTTASYWNCPAIPAAARFAWLSRHAVAKAVGTIAVKNR